ncbi:MAG TPA: SpoIIE family protein phosphatase [Vicinamibacterales bacterium]|nr:SpoIIE family protein phosphatase [Vicinamibacterales bacterium]
MSTSPRILVADDQNDILQALRLLLSEAGFTTDLVKSVHGAIQRVAGATYDLLLMDLNYTRDTTSGREGLQLLDEVRARDAALPIVVMTGWGSIEMAVDAMRRGARSFVQKPWDDATLIEVVRREVDLGRAGRRRDAQLAHEHEEARLIQRALLPSVIPSIRGCTLAARWTPACGVGGDCYDLLQFGESRVAISIGDVIGKGVPAALLMSNLQAAVRAFATPEAEPHRVCANVNRLLCRNIEAGRFVTFCYAVIDTAAKAVVYSNAGHNPPILMRRSGSAERLTTKGLVLGVACDWCYGAGELPLEPGDRLICFTDGITEAESQEGEEFGDERLIAIVRAAGPVSADELVGRITEAVAGWCGGQPRDDATLVVAAID